MPKGFPNTTLVNEGPRKLTITLRPVDYDALSQLAVEQYRTVELQASWLLAKVLSEAGRTPPISTVTVPPSIHAARIMERANSRAATEDSGS